MTEWPLIESLPSYGRGRDNSGGRYASLITGSNLTNVIITGENGTINGQGEMWWQKFHHKQLKNTRPYLIELMYSDNFQIFHLTLIDSSSWNIHPVYCNLMQRFCDDSNILIQDITISAPVNSPNTDGINPDRPVCVTVIVRPTSDNSDSSTSLTVVESVQNLWDNPEDRIVVVGLGLTTDIALWASLNGIAVRHGLLHCIIDESYLYRIF